SLLDVTPTLAALAGLERDESWSGRSLLLAPDQPGDRLLFAFEDSNDGRPSAVVLEGTRKVLVVPSEAQGFDPITAAQIARDHYRLLGAFDVGGDATESRDEAAAGSAWPREFLARHAAELEAAMRPLVERLEGKPGKIDAEKATELRALGY